MSLGTTLSIILSYSAQPSVSTTLDQKFIYSYYNKSKMSELKLTARDVDIVSKALQCLVSADALKVS